MEMGDVNAVTVLPAHAELCKAENDFKPDIVDFLFALVAFALGYLFSRWVFFFWQGWGVTLFTTAYLLTVTAYLVKKGAFVNSGEAWFWLAVTWLTGASYALWANAGFAWARNLFLFCASAYYVVAASGRTIMGKTGNYLFFDGANALIIIPFRNFANQYVSFSALSKGGKRRKAMPIILGVILALALAAVLIPMLERADSGGFGIILKFVTDLFTFDVVETLLYIALAIPVAAYLYGLASGAAHKKGTDAIKPESAENAAVAMRVFQSATVFIVLGAVCGIYLVFILSQLPYFFSAFTGNRPEGWLIYSEYARHGFFELCSIAAINLAILTIGNVMSKKLRAESRTLKALNIALALITLVLIATAFSKMALYIGAYGLTMPRLLPCVFMLFLAAVFAALVALQKWDFSIVRFALVTGAVILCALCLANPDAIVVRYNTDRYLSGTLREYDTRVLHRAGSAGVLPALEVYEATQDSMVKENIRAYLEVQHCRLDAGNFFDGEGHRTNLENQRAREALGARATNQTRAAPP